MGEKPRDFEAAELWDPTWFYVVAANFPKQFREIDDPANVCIVHFEVEEPDQRFRRSR